MLREDLTQDVYTHCLLWQTGLSWLAAGSDIQLKHTKVLFAALERLRSPPKALSLQIWLICRQ